MSLLNEASFLVTPNGYKEDKLYAAIPTNGNGDMTVTRATTATRVNEAGLVELVPYNLLSRSEDFANASWTKLNSSTVVLDATVANPTGILSTYKYTASNLSFGGILRNPATITTATTYTLSFFVKKGNHSFVGIRFNTAANSDRYITYNFDTDTIHQQGVTATAVASRELFANGWVRFILVYTSTTSSGTSDIAITNSSGSTPTTLTGTEYMYVYGAQLVEGSSALTYQKTVDRLDIPRIDYTGGGCPSILLEPQRTNIVLRSQEFDNVSWLKFQVSVTANALTAPDGTLTADLVTVTSDAGNRLNQAVAVTASTKYTFSFYAKAGTLETSSYSVYDLTNSANVLKVAYEMTEEWQRITSTFTTPVGCTSINIYTTRGQIESGTYYVWGAQLEAGTYPTSYIPTVALAVARNADVISKTGISDLIGQTEGVMFIESAALFNDLTQRTIAISDGTSNNRLYLFYSTTSNAISIFGTASGTSFPLGVSYTISDETQFAKIAVRYRANDISLWVNGEKRGTDLTSQALPINFSRFGFDSGTGGSVMYAKVKQVQLYKTYLKDAEMESLTTL